MYPQIKFNEILSVENIIKNNETYNETSACLFSGGIDAVCTTIRHIDDNPLLINVQGSDIDVNNENVLNEVHKKILEVANKMNLNLVVIKSSFKKMFKYRYIDFMIKKKANDTYWHGFQHGLSLLSLCCPLTYKYKINKLYIASSYTKDDVYTCASDPSIDNYVKLSKCSVVHDAYELDRDDKIKLIGSYIKENKINLNLRVCFDDTNKNNCCKCEKCYRTISEIEVNGFDVEKFGFNIDDKFYDRLKHDMDFKILLTESVDWKRIQKAAIKNKDYSINYEWIYDYDFNKNHHIFIKKMKRYINIILRQLKKIRRK